MPYFDAGKYRMLEGPGLKPSITHLSVHTAAPNSSGSNEATGGSPAYARKVPSFGTTSAGVLPLSSAITFDLPAGTYTHIAAWDGTTCLGYGPLPASRIYAGQDTLVVSTFNPDLNA